MCILIIIFLLVEIKKKWLVELPSKTFSFSASMNFLQLFCATLSKASPISLSLALNVTWLIDGILSVDVMALR